MLVFEERVKPKYPEKNLSEQGGARSNNKLNPHMTPGPGVKPGTYWWEASAHGCLENSNREWRIVANSE